MHPKDSIPEGYCQCGCGQRTRISKQTETARGYVKGRPMRYLPGHATRKPFWDKVQKSAGSDVCWIWTAGKNADGYGTLGGGLRAHRVSYEMRHGPIPNGMCVCHSCDNPSCVNPAHLWLGTHQDNMADRSRKGRSSGGRMVGTEHPNAKLTDDMVREIRHLYASGEYMQKDLARMYGVSDMVISLLVRGKTWKHVV